MGTIGSKSNNKVRRSSDTVQRPVNNNRLEGDGVVTLNRSCHSIFNSD